MCMHDLFCAQDECSFVSLRDVERAMIVFEYLYGMMDELGPRMDEYAMKEFYNEDDDDVSLQLNLRRPQQQKTYIIYLVV